jgi:hypothetical protein
MLYKLYKDVKGSRTGKIRAFSSSNRELQFWFITVVISTLNYVTFSNELGKVGKPEVRNLNHRYAECGAESSFILRFVSPEWSAQCNLVPCMSDWVVPSALTACPSLVVVQSVQLFQLLSFGSCFDQRCCTLCRRGMINSFRQNERVKNFGIFESIYACECQFFCPWHSCYEKLPTLIIRNLKCPKQTQCV